MSQVATMSQVEAKHGVTDFESRKVNSLVGLRTRVRLHVGSFGAEKLFRAISSHVFQNVNMFATTVVSAARVTFSVLVRQHATGGFHDRHAGVIFAGDHFEAVLLANGFGVDQVKNFFVLSLQIHGRFICGLNVGVVVGHDYRELLHFFDG